MKGVYIACGRKIHGNYYYDRIKEEANNQFIKIKTPEIIRQSIKEGDIYIFKGCLDRRIDENGNIKLTYVIAEVISQQKKQISDEEFEKIEIQRKKAILGYKDLELAIKNKLYVDERPNIALIYGSTGIVNQDFNTAMKEARTKYNITEHRINLSSKQEIINKLEELNKKSFLDGCDVIAILRGGGPGLAIFGNVDIAKEVLELKPIFITAIGHAEDVTLLG